MPAMKLKLGKDVNVPVSTCTNCGVLADAATGVAAHDHEGEIVPEPGDFTVCLQCGHIMTFADDLTLRDLTDEEVIRAAGDKRLIAIQDARANVVYNRAYCEDLVREKIKRVSEKSSVPSHEIINMFVDETLAYFERKSKS